MSEHGNGILGWIKDHPIAVGTAASVIGTLAVGALSAYGSYKATKSIDDYEYNCERNRTMTKKEKAKVYAKDLAPAGALAAATITNDIVGAVKMGKKLDKFKSAAAALAAGAARFGEKLTIEQKKDIMEKELNNFRGDLADNEILVYDGIRGEYFTVNQYIMDELELHINKLLHDEGVVSVNDAYYYLGMSPFPEGDAFGWNLEMLEEKYGRCWIDVDLTKVSMDDDLDAYYFDFKEIPSPDYRY